MHSYIDSDKVATPVLRSARLLDQLRERIRHLHYSLQTEKAYLYWAQFFIRWHARNGAMRHPKDMGKPEVEAFLAMLANERQVSPAPHRQYDHDLHPRAESCCRWSQRPAVCAHWIFELNVGSRCFGVSVQLFQKPQLTWHNAVASTGTITPQPSLALRHFQ